MACAPLSIARNVSTLTAAPSNAMIWFSNVIRAPCSLLISSSYSFFFFKENIAPDQATVKKAGFKRAADRMLTLFVLAVHLLFRFEERGIDFALDVRLSEARKR